ncbi:immunoglobulin superfamily member 1-like, partial [Astyanax mexicanus]
DLPRASLTVAPDSTVFTGESVTLKCEITGYDGWRYQWFYKKNWGGWSAVSQSEFYTVNSNTLTIREDAVIDGDQYRCRGELSNRPTSSQYSNSVTLTVKDLPRASLTVDPDSTVFTGESVTLKCEITGYDGWRYQWFYKKNNWGGWSAVYQSGFYTVNSNTLTIRGNAVINGDQYRCRGELSNRPSSQYSDSVTLTVKVTLIVSPSRSQHFTTDSLSLICEGQSNSTGWRVRRYSHSESKVSDCSSGWGSVTGSTCSISSLYTSHTGVYWCESESGGSSNPVNITVHSESALFTNRRLVKVEQR